MPNIEILNEEWEHRIQQLFRLSFRQADITKSKRLRDLARRSETRRLNWLNQVLN
jgi:hypothetical protein